MRTLQSLRAEQSRAEQSRVRVIGSMDNRLDHTFESANRVYDANCICPTIPTCGGGGIQPKVIEVMKLNDDKMPVLLGGVGKENEFGKQYRQGNRVYDSDGTAMAITSQPIGNAGGNSYLYLEKKKVTDAQALRMVRTEEGKALRKSYECGEIHHGFNEHRKAEPREDGCANTLSTVLKDNHIIQTQRIVAMRGRNPENPSDRTAGIHLEQRLEPQEDGICNCLTSVQKDNLVLEKKTVKTIKIKQATKEGFVDLEIGGVVDLDYPNSETRRGRVIEGGNVPPTLTTTTVPYVVELANPDFYNFLYEIDGELYLIRIRKLVPLECFRLMGVSNEDANKMLNVNSNTQCYKQAGNSIVVTVLMGIFSQLGISGCKKWNDMSDTEINQMIQKCR